MPNSVPRSMTRAQRQIVDWVDEHQSDVIGLTQAMVRIPSENKPPHGDERECQMFIADWLRSIGCRVDVFTPAEVVGLVEHPEYWSGRDYTNRPNVVGVLGQFDPRVGRSKDRRSLLFSGHADVTPALGEGRLGWWDATVEDGKMYGRGTCDMKGGMAAYMMAARCIQDLKLERKGDLILESVVDEEFGGANGTLAGRVRGYNADAAIVPEPNNMLVSAGHRGGQVFRLHTSAPSVGMGFGATALPDPVTAMGHLLVRLEQMNAEFNARPKPAGFENDVFPLMPLLLRGGEVTPWGAGDAIPESARLEFWLELPPGWTKTALHSELQAMIDKATRETPALRRVTTRWEELTRFLAGTSIPADSPILKTLGDNFIVATGQDPTFRAAPFACDVFLFNLCSPTPCVLLGPHGGNAHAPDEWVDIGDLISLTKIFALTIADWLT
jgi:acetylornithine deacetylase